MSLSLILIILAMVLAGIDMVIWNTTLYSRMLLTPLAVILMGLAWLISSGAIHT